MIVFQKVLLFIGLFFLCTQCTPSKKINSKAAPINHELWTTVLQEYVSDDGAVNYRDLKENRTQFDEYIQLLSSNHPNKKWSDDELRSVNAQIEYVLRDALRKAGRLKDK